MNTRDRWDASRADWSGFESDLEVSDEDFVAAIEQGRRAEDIDRPDITWRN
ncbi:MAG: hypothetical protein OEU32_14995 [Acidimicrobiia bacterium]|nr:hypothetical protein [Acidimicrobiia bacterium]